MLFEKVSADDAVMRLVRIVELLAVMHHVLPFGQQAGQ